MKIQIISDVHGCFDYVEWDKKADLVLALGDISENPYKAVNFLATSPVPVFYICGNHEFYNSDLLERNNLLKELCDNHKNLNFLENSNVKIGDLRLLSTTLWSDFNEFDVLSIDNAISRMNDYRNIYNKNSFEDNLLFKNNINTLRNTFLEQRKNIILSSKKSLIKDNIINNFLFRNGLKEYDEKRDFLNLIHGNEFKNDNKFSPFFSFFLNSNNIQWLKKQTIKKFNGKTILMTHHSPSKIPLVLNNYTISLSTSYFSSVLRRVKNYSKSGSYTSSLDNFIYENNFYCCLHGHFHENIRYLIGDSPIICNPTAYFKKIKTIPAPYIIDTKNDFNKFGIFQNQLQKFYNFIDSIISLYKQIENNTVFLDKFRDIDLFKGFGKEVSIILDNIRYNEYYIKNKNILNIEKNDPLTDFYQNYSNEENKELTDLEIKIGTDTVINYLENLNNEIMNNIKK